MFKPNESEWKRRQEKPESFVEALLAGFALMFLLYIINLFAYVLGY